MVIAKNAADADKRGISTVLLKREARMEKLNLTKMKSGDRGTVTEIKGGQGVKARLNALGIRPGAKITKKSSQLLRGPVTIGMGNTQAAIGFGMAKKIIIDLEQ
jgi:ferrous iron transport protein A